MERRDTYTHILELPFGRHICLFSHIPNPKALGYVTLTQPSSKPAPTTAIFLG